MKRLTKFIAALIVLAFVFSATKVSAADYHQLYQSPTLEQEVDMVFSVAKGEVDDQTENGTHYDGRPYADYSQIHENVNGSGNSGRYTIHNVSGSAISVGIQNYLGEGDIRNVNEAYLDNAQDLIENILGQYAGIDYEYACQVAAKYMVAHRDDITLEGYRELWNIDWVTMKLQQENGGRIHVDGKIVFYEIEEPIEEEPTLIEEEPTPIEEPTPEEEEPTSIEDEPIVENDPVVEEEQIEEIIPTPSPIPRIDFIIIPSFITEAPTSIPEPTATPVPTEAPTLTPVEEEVEVEVIETPEGAPEEEVEIEESETPEGTPEEDIEVEIPDIPESLPQTGVTDNKVFYGLGAWMIALGLILIHRRKALL